MPSFVGFVPIYFRGLPNGTFNSLYTNFHTVLLDYPEGIAAGAFR